MRDLRGDRDTGLIRVHEFNSEWWGSPVGIVDDPAFFSLGPAERARLLQSYEWVEYRAAAGRHPSFQTICSAEFFHSDTQLDFDIALDKVKSTPGLGDITARFADERSFAIPAEDIRPFTTERFMHLPGVTAERVSSRYALWGNKLVAEFPEWCMEAFEGDEVQGWYFGRMTDRGLNLVLAMLRPGARIRGRDLYRKAMVEYAQRGATTAWATHSVSHLPVLNILTALGAHYLGVEHFWLWTGGCGGE